MSIIDHHLNIDDTNRGSYMIAHVLLNLLNKFGKKEIKCEAGRTLYRFFATSFNR